MRNVCTFGAETIHFHRRYVETLFSALSQWTGVLEMSIIIIVSSFKSQLKTHLLNSIQFNSKTLIIPQGAILLWSWRALKNKNTQQNTHTRIKLREQYNKHNTTNKETLTIVEL